MTAVIEGEVVSDTHRRRERSLIRSFEVLPPDVETKVGALRRLDGSAQATAVTAMLSHSRTGLLAAIAAQDLPQIVAWKQKAAAIQEIAKQVRLGKELQLDAAEFVRRAERGLGVAIREGQGEGRIAKRGDIGGGRRSSPVDNLVSVRDFATKGELSGKTGIDGIYAMTDGVSDEQFEKALTEAKSEGNLSRANVARKAKAQARKEPIADDDPLIDAEVAPKPEKPKTRLTKHNSTEMLANINGMLNGIVETLPFIDPTDIDTADRENRRVIENMRQSMARIRKLLKEIENG